MIQNIARVPFKAPKLPKIDPRKLGWQHPDGRIIFQTTEVAEEYANNRVLQALKCKKPFERGIVVKSKQILGEFNGDASTIKTDALTIDKTKGATFVHGHPNLFAGGEPPLSLQDYVTFVSCQFKKIVALNSKGEHSTMEKLPKSKWRVLFPQKLVNIYDTLSAVGSGAFAVERYAKMWSTFLPQELQAVGEALIHTNISKTAPIFANQKLAKAGEEHLSNIPLRKMIGKIEKGLFESGDAQKAIDSFWLFNAKDLEYTYTTNFSHLRFPFE